VLTAANGYMVLVTDHVPVNSYSIMLIIRPSC